MLVSLFADMVYAFCFSLYSSFVCFIFLSSDVILIILFPLRIYTITGALLYSPVTDLGMSYIGILAVEGNTRSAASVCLALSASYRHDTISGTLRLLCESFELVLKTISNCQVFLQLQCINFSLYKCGLPSNMTVH